jgi:Myb/SANT-like DNA-binding domain
METVKKGRVRCVNFTHEEEYVLAQEHVKEGRILDGEFSANVTAQHKEMSWERLLDAVNAVSPTVRSKENINKPKAYYDN